MDTPRNRAVVLLGIDRRSHRHRDALLGCGAALGTNSAVRQRLGLGLKACLTASGESKAKSLVLLWSSDRLASPLPIPNRH